MVGESGERDGNCSNTGELASMGNKLRRMGGAKTDRKLRSSQGRVFDYCLPFVVAQEGREVGAVGRILGGLGFLGGLCSPAGEERLLGIAVRLRTSGPGLNLNPE